MASSTALALSSLRFSHRTLNSCATVEVQVAPPPNHGIGEARLGPERPVEILPHASEVHIDGGSFTNIAGGLCIYQQPGSSQKSSPDAEPAVAPPSGSRRASASAELPPIEPIRSENEIYSGSLLAFRRGFPLLDGTPQPNLPDAYRRCGIRIGDVGRVSPEGAFDFLFNIYLPADHPINGNRVPADFAPLAPFDPIDVYVKDLKRGSIASSSVVSGCRDLDVGDIELEFTCFGSSGAFLALPQGSRLYKLENIEAMRRYAARNAESWYYYANETRGRRLVNGGLYLITGHEKAGTGGMATFQNIRLGREFDISLVPLPGDEGAVKYAFSRGDPARTRTFSTTSPASVDQPNATVFVQGLTISLGEGILQRLLGKGVAFSPIGEKPYSSSQEGWIPFGSQGSFLSFSFGLFTGSGGAAGKQAAALEAHQIDVADICSPSQTSHPSRTLHEDLRRTFPEASAIVVDDEVWMDAVHRSGGVFNDAELLSQVIEHFAVVHEEGSLFLTRSQSCQLPEREAHQAESSYETETQIGRQELEDVTSQRLDSHSSSELTALPALEHSSLSGADRGDLLTAARSWYSLIATRSEEDDYEPGGSSHSAASCRTDPMDSEALEPYSIDHSLASGPNSFLTGEDYPQPFSTMSLVGGSPVHPTDHSAVGLSGLPLSSYFDEDYQPTSADVSYHSSHNFDSGQETVARQRTESEQRRRDELREGYARLRAALPATNGTSNWSKVALLDRATNHVRHLESAKSDLEARLQEAEGTVKHLRELNEALSRSDGREPKRARTAF